MLALVGAVNGIKDKTTETYAMEVATSLLVMLYVKDAFDLNQQARDAALAYIAAPRKSQLEHILTLLMHDHFVFKNHEQLPTERASDDYKAMVTEARRITRVYNMAPNGKDLGDPAEADSQG